MTRDWDNPRPPRTMGGDDLEVSDRKYKGATGDVSRVVGASLTQEQQFYVAATELCLVAARYLSYLMEETEP